VLFNSLQFALFFVLVWGGVRALPARARAPLLLSASALFYGLWLPAHLLLLGFTLVVNFALLQWMRRSKRPRVPLTLSIVFTLGLLAFFKYAAFAVETLLPVLQLGLGWSPPIPEFFLPLGISFYSFQIVALSVDVYRGRVSPPDRLARYALFVSFFPQLIAGPIMRGHELLPQLERGGEVTRERTRRGVWLLTTGLAKKVLLADFLLAPFVNDVFGNPELASAPLHLMAIYSFAFQIYFDFSGYSDIARGLGLLLGFELSANFLEPYLARNPAEFWRRWHVTLSRWFRDYLYIPLGGNRDTQWRTGCNLMLTMLLGGLWHGASWNFVIWGGLHGVLLVAHRFFSRGANHDGPWSGGDIVRVALMFHAACLLWIFFRAANFGDSLIVLQALFTKSYLGPWPTLQSAIVLTCAALHLAERWARGRHQEWQHHLDTHGWGPALEAAAVGIIAALALLTTRGGTEFIYFQF
jgi:D-alanyl-lipoteichoic acid acyltransferase DltB (MBOAT superfamily)